MGKKGKIKIIAALYNDFGVTILINKNMVTNGEVTHESIVEIVSKRCLSCYCLGVMGLFFQCIFFKKRFSAT